MCEIHMNGWNKQQAAGWVKTNKVDTRQEGAGEGLSLTRGRGQDGHVREVLQGIAAQVCLNVYRDYDVVIRQKRRKKVLQ